MTQEIDAAAIKDLIRQLRLMDSHHRVFGSGKHKHRLKPRLSDAEVGCFEHRHAILLPGDNRQFLIEFGNGGAGPCCGLIPFGAEDGRDPSKPFPFTQATSQLPD